MAAMTQAIDCMRMSRAVPNSQRKALCSCGKSEWTHSGIEYDMRSSDLLCTRPSYKSRHPGQSLVDAWRYRGRPLGWLFGIEAHRRTPVSLETALLLT